MESGIAAGAEDEFLLLRGEALEFDGDGVFAEGDSFETKFAGVSAGDGLRPGGVCRVQRDLRPLHRAVLRIVDQTADRPEDCGEGSQAAQQQPEQERSSCMSYVLLRMRGSA